MKKQKRINLFYYFVKGVFEARDSAKNLAGKILDGAILNTIKEEMDAIEQLKE